VTGAFGHGYVVQWVNYIHHYRYLRQLQNGIYKEGGGAPVGSGAPVVHSKEAAFD